MAEQVKSFIRNTITPLASFVMFDVLNVNFFLSYFGLSLETLEGDQEKKMLEQETKRKIEAEEVSERKKIKPSEELNIKSEDSKGDEEERPGSRQKLWNLTPEINFTESLKMQVNFSGPKKYITPTESFEGDILKDVHQVDTDEVVETVSDVVFVSSVDVVNNPYHFESVTEYAVIPNPEINDDAITPTQAVVDVGRNEASTEEDVTVTSEGVIDPLKAETDDLDDDIVLITTQDLTNLLKEETDAADREKKSAVDAQDGAGRITVEDIDAMMKCELKLIEKKNVDASKDKKTSEAPIDAGNIETLKRNRKLSEIVNVESDENDEIIKDETPGLPMAEVISSCVVDPNGSLESGGSLEVGLEATEDAYAVLDEASDLLTDKTNILNSSNQENGEEEVQIIPVVSDKENKVATYNKAAETKSNGRKGKNKKKVF